MSYYNQKKITTNIITPGELKKDLSKFQLNSDTDNKLPTPASNYPSNTIQETPELSEKKSDINRSLEKRRDLDEFSNVNIGLQVIDDAILYHMKNNLNITVSLNDSEIRVPVIYADPEKWKSSQEDGFLKDNKGQIQYPIIILRRTGFSRNDQLMTLNRYIKQQVYVKRNPDKNKYDLFGMLDSKTNTASSQNGSPIPRPDRYYVTCPDYIIVNYEVTVWTNYVTHMNKILEKINFAAEEYWGNREIRIFRTRIPNYTHTNEVQVDDDRVVKTTFGLEVWGYLIPEIFENFRPTLTKESAPRKVIIGLETSINDKELINISPVRKNQNQKISTTNLYPKSVRETTLSYISYQKSIPGIFVSNDGTDTTIKFENTRLLPTPNYLARTIKESDKFLIFINSSSVNKLSVISFEQISTDFVVVLLNTSLSPITIDTTSKIYALGKFE